MRTIENQDWRLKKNLCAFGFHSTDPEGLLIEKLSSLIPDNLENLPDDPEGELELLVGETNETWFGPAPTAIALHGKVVSGWRNLRPSPIIGAAFGKHEISSNRKKKLPELPEGCTWGWDGGRLVIWLSDNIMLSQDRIRKIKQDGRSDDCHFDLTEGGWWDVGVFFSVLPKSGLTLELAETWSHRMTPVYMRLGELVGAKC